MKSCAFWGKWQLKHCFTGSVAIGFVESPPAHAWNPRPPVDAYFFESLTMRVMAFRAEQSNQMASNAEKSQTSSVNMVPSGKGVEAPRFKRSNPVAFT